MSENTFKVWITKYALTEGIREKEVEGSRRDGVVEIVGSNGIYCHGEGKEWHKDKESAIKRAEEMRNKEIIKLEKKIQKLKDMKFE